MYAFRMDRTHLTDVDNNGVVIKLISCVLHGNETHLEKLQHFKLRASGCFNTSKHQHSQTIFRHFTHSFV